MNSVTCRQNSESREPASRQRVRAASLICGWKSFRCRRVWTGLLLISLFSGCEGEPQFQPNLVFVRNQKLVRTVSELESPEVATHLDDIDRIVQRFFGTPDDPRVLQAEESDLSSILDSSLVKQAAGPYRRDDSGRVAGIYREYCARCHGVTGNGRGPVSALLNPYPRDFRRGIFKFKSTPQSYPPTDEDLRYILRRGIPGTSMPSFAAMPENERKALAHYVRYLSLRGWFERALIAETAIELDPGDRLLDPQLEELNPAAFADDLEYYEGMLVEQAQQWIDAEQKVPEIPSVPADLDSNGSVESGRKLFFTTMANCAKCHGELAAGDGQVDEYDDWSKEVEPGNELALEDYLSLGALPPRKVKPRNLRLGVYRGGAQPSDIFRRVRYGIAGTTMPEVANQLTDQEVWYLVAFVRHLPREAGHRPQAERKGS